MPLPWELPLYEQYIQVRRQWIEHQEQRQSEPYSKLLHDLADSTDEWRHWRANHPEPGTMVRLHRAYKWLMPIAVTALSPETYFIWKAIEWGQKIETEWAVGSILRTGIRSKSRPS